jgi:hypothetical protein
MAAPFGIALTEDQGVVCKVQKIFSWRIHLHAHM